MWDLKTLKRLNEERAQYLRVQMIRDKKDSELKDVEDEESQRKRLCLDARTRTHAG